MGVGTVSRVLNGSRQVRPATRERVVEVIEQLDFRPNRTARNLSLGRTHSVAAVVPFVTNPSCVARLRGFIAVMAVRGYDVVLFDVEHPGRRDDQLRRLEAGAADAVLVVALTPGDEQVDRFAAARTPVVLLDAEHPRLPHVVIDDVEGGVLATRHLLELGHRRIGYVGDSPTGFGWGSRRREGYERALRDAGLRADPVLAREGRHGKAVAHALTAELLALSEPPTAVFAASDTQALGALDAARDAGLDVPGDVSVVGFDDLEVAHVAGLTTVRQPLAHSGERAAELLLALVDGQDVGPVREVLPLELVRRATTAPPAR